MLYNYWKLAFRNLFKSPLFTFLNLSGLALGIASSFVLLAYVQQELSTDKHFRDHERIYRVATDFFNMGGFAKSQPVLHRYLSTECKDVETATVFNRNYSETAVHTGDKTYLEPGVFAVDPAFFQVFSYTFREGGIGTQGLAPDEAILSESMANKYFGAGPAIGQTIQLGKEQKEYRITGVLAESRAKSHLKPAIVTSIYPGFKPDENWSAAAVYNYVKLKPEATRESFTASLTGILKNYAYPASQSQQTFEQWSASNNAVRFFVQPLTDIYLHSNFKIEVMAGGNPMQVYILGIIGAFILLIAAANYVNLTTARSSTRAKEVGMKKALGAGKAQLVRQFLSESVLLSVLAMILGIGLSEGLLRVFHYVTGQELLSSLFQYGDYMLLFLLYAVAVGVFAGIYPAFYLTAFKPVKILKGELGLDGNKGFRSSLVVLQFGIAVFLMIGAGVVYRQLRFMQEKDLGFAKEGILVIENAGLLGDKVQVFKDQILQQNQVVSASLNMRTPAGKSIVMYTYKTSDMPEDLTLQTFPADAAYLQTLEMHLTQGRNFDKEQDTDSTAVILNESAVKALGLSDPIGAEVNPGQKVVGVIRDFHFQSLREKVEPTVLQYSEKGGQLALKIRGADLSQVLNSVESTWNTFGAGEPLRYAFIDDSFAQLLEKERVLSKAVSIFTFLALFIACLGLFGLAAFMAERRNKEIGIRKVLGASIVQVMTLLTRDFLKPVLLAVVLGIPLAYWAVQQWLNGFAYRIEAGWQTFALAGLAAVLIAAATVSLQSVRAALENPVKSLRS